MYKRIMKNNILVPEKLERGDTIGIAAPASPFDLKKFRLGVDVLKSMGFNVYIPEGIFSRNGYLAGTDHQRASILNSLFSDKDIKAILCARGGFGSLKILSALDYDKIQKNPKIFIGYSDVTAVLSALYKKCRLITFHGPMAAELGSTSQRTREAMFSVLSSRADFEIFSRNGTSLKPGTGSGIVLGGNLSTLCHLTGTPYFPDVGGSILFIEERGEAVYRIDRMLTHMKMAGCFKGISGLVLGSFTDCGSVKEINKIIAGLFEKIDIPILSGFTAGHGKENITIPFGLKATLDAGGKLLSFRWPAID